MENDLNQRQKNILIYILLPIYYLPKYTKSYNPDKPHGEKTFSKMVLNLSVMHAKCKFEYVTGVLHYFFF
ncbi:hypothetical protein DICPUDRAFT_154723 [Dictyostelium purpureum]|uniref:Uncharacterized protein n=1 Tax=Dictyostelium purpureum TaxID=5786 RepID=F0ZS34_DICPU|nr:uncharacterized protein DICPUDRAFT_154723 [Dictyostelium purpureum]EGC33235.1 hypothetical protein DICPUDRAFT_154723 [Dictyostelium purpureum]|eukprot:XP_003290228.1 hypothetical protein DICPUDRAFT_154723 [Dictyostelium purpureum]